MIKPDMTSLRLLIDVCDFAIRFNLNQFQMQLDSLSFDLQSFFNFIVARFYHDGTGRMNSSGTVVIFNSKLGVDGLMER